MGCKGKTFLDCTRLVVVCLGEEHPKAGKGGLERNKWENRGLRR